MIFIPELIDRLWIYPDFQFDHSENRGTFSAARYFAGAPDFFKEESGLRKFNRGEVVN
jgi:hypothetical protein